MTKFEPRRVGPEDFRRMLRERQTLCPGCGVVVEGVDRFTDPMGMPDELPLGCEACDSFPMFGLLAQLRRGLVALEPETEERLLLSEELFEGMPGSHEGKDECSYVWVDGQFENLDEMRTDKLLVLVHRLGRMSEEDHAKVERRVAREKERVRSVWAAALGSGERDEEA